jgi:IS4 transposase
MGIRGNVTRTNLAYANEHRDWRVYAELGRVLIAKARRLYADEKALAEVDEMVYALDSSTIDLCLSLFPWADFRTTKAAVKLHTLMDLRGSIPVFLRITPGAVHDVNILDELPIEPGAVYVMDRGYVDFGRLYRIERQQAHFLTRAKSNLQFTVLESRPVDKSTGLRCDQTVRLKGSKSRAQYPKVLRRIRYRDLETGKTLVFLTNNFVLSALTIAALYKSRWQIELFFKWIKQNLCIENFYGISPNAVKTQIWTAICAYLLVICAKKSHAIPESPSRILQVLSINVFQKEPLPELLSNNVRNENQTSNSNQLMLKGF